MSRFKEHIAYTERNHMEANVEKPTRVAILAIVVEDRSQVETLNHILHENGRYIIGRMGLPYDKKDISLISVAIDAPQDVISAVSGQIGKLHGITAKAVYSKLPEN